MIKSSNSVSGASAGSSSQSDLRRVLLWAALLAAGTVLLYAPALRNGFVNFDDPDYVIRNSHVLQGLTWQNVRWAFGTDNPAANWHPLTWISHMLDVQLYGTNPAGHHFTNISFQAMDVALLFFLLYRATSHLYRSAVVAALFAIHPLNVESVAWAAERKTVLCMLFFLLTIWAYGWYVRKRGVARYLCVLVLFALALMSKLMVLSLPFALLLLDYWPLQRFADALQTGEKPHFLSIFLRLFAEKIPLFLLSISAAVITLRLHRKDGALAGAMPLSWRLPNAVYSYAVYLGKLVWPSRLAVFYPHPENTLASWKVISAALLLAAVSAIVWRFRDKTYLLIGWLWFLGTMVPMIGIVQSGRQGMAGRFMYIPMLGLMLAAVWLVGEWATRVGWQKGIVALAFALLALPYIVATEKQISYWHDSLSLFSYTLAVTSNNGIAENNFAVALMEQGRADLAQPHFVSAVRLIPELASAHYNLAVTFQLQGQAEEAARQYRLAIACSSDPVEVAQAHNNLGMLYLASKNYVAALLELNAAIAANPNEQNSYIARGQIELDSWNYPAAVADFARAAKISPSPVACFWLGRALEKQGDSAQAAQAYQYALQLAPGMTEARVRLDALRDNAAAHP